MDNFTTDAEEKSVFSFLSLFPNNDIKNVLFKIAHTQRRWKLSLKDSKASPAHKYNCYCYCSCCSDSRENVQLDSADVAQYRIPGGFSTSSEGILNDDCALAIELASDNRIPVFVVRQHSRCGAMGIIYACHSKGTPEEGFEYVSEHYGPAFAAMAKRRKGLYKTVLEKAPLIKEEDGKKYYDFSYYESTYGIPMFGDGVEFDDDESRFQACMAIEQGAIDFEATAKECEDLGGTTKALFVYNHLAQGGRKYVQVPGQKRFVLLPLSSDPEFDADMAKLLENFPDATMHERIREESYSQHHWAEENKLKKDTVRTNMAKVQEPEEAIFRSSNPDGDEHYDDAKAPGQALFHRTVGNFLVDAYGVLKFSAAQFLELARAYKVPVVQIEQLSGGEGIDAIYDYYAREVEKDSKDGKDSRQKLLESKRPRLVRLAQSQSSLYDEVDYRIKTEGFTYYEAKLGNSGISLGETHKEKFKKCMAIQQGLVNYRAVDAVYKDSLKRYVAAKMSGKKIENHDNLTPAACMIFKDIDTQTTCVLHPDSETLYKIPEMDDNGFLFVNPLRGLRKTKLYSSISLFLSR